MRVTFKPEDIERNGYDWLASWQGSPTFYCWQMVIGLYSGQDFAQMKAVRIDADRDIWAVIREKGVPVKPYKCRPLLA